MIERVRIDLGVLSSIGIFLALCVVEGEVKTGKSERSQQIVEAVFSRRRNPASKQFVFDADSEGAGYATPASLFFFPAYSGLRGS